jgi:hypothetical protein
VRISIRVVLLSTAVALLCGCQPNAKHVKATISYIDRNCEIIQTTYDGDYKEKSRSTYTDSCSSIDEWDKVREKRDKKVAGKAVVHVDYTAPQTGQSLSGEIKFDGGDDEFYTLKAGDQIDILVSDADPTKIAIA